MSENPEENGLKTEEKPLKDEKGLFLPGNPGGPGRPKGSFSIMTIIRQKMDEIPVGQVKEWKSQIADILLEEAVVKRNMKALEMIVEYMDGKPKQTIDVDVNKENVDSLTNLLREMSKIDGRSTTDTDSTPAESPALAGGSQG